LKISERFNLDANQYTLDFVDIDTDRDIPLFLDPSFLGLRPDAWSRSASRTLRNFFETFVALMRAKQEDRARELFQHLHEPNETCLGLSKGPPQGNAIGDVDGEKLFQSIAQSRAIDTGVIEDLEDFRLFVEGIDKDKISDMTTNIIRRHLIEYTQNQCALWGISLQENTQTGFWWCPATRTWENAFAAMLVVEGKKILLTPKSVVSYCKRYAPRKYHGRFVLEFLQNEHIRMQSIFVRHRKNGVPYVTKKSLEERVAAFSKEFIAEFTATHPDVFDPN
jgi:hypothetical protein